MKITKNKLKQIIKEELKNVLQEEYPHADSWKAAVERGALDDLGRNITKEHPFDAALRRSQYAREWEARWKEREGGPGSVSGIPPERIRTHMGIPAAVDAPPSQPAVHETLGPQSDPSDWVDPGHVWEMIRKEINEKMKPEEAGRRLGRTLNLEEREELRQKKIAVRRALGRKEECMAMEPAARGHCVHARRLEAEAALNLT
jgi:hypothetical protein